MGRARIPASIAGPRVRPGVSGCGVRQGRSPDERRRDPGPFRAAAWAGADRGRRPGRSRMILTDIRETDLATSPSRSGARRHSRQRPSPPASLTKVRAHGPRRNPCVCRWAPSQARGFGLRSEDKIHPTASLTEVRVHGPSGDPQDRRWTTGRARGFGLRQDGKERSPDARQRDPGPFRATAWAIADRGRQPGRSRMILTDLRETDLATSPSRSGARRHSRQRPSPPGIPDESQDPRAAPQSLRLLLGRGSSPGLRLAE